MVEADYLNHQRGSICEIIRTGQQRTMRMQSQLAAKFRLKISN
jgi:hypothetical protein